MLPSSELEFVPDFPFAGVQDDGKPVGISDNELKESLRTLRVMAAGVAAEIKGVRVQKGEKGKLAKVIIRRRESRSVNFFFVYETL